MLRTLAAALLLASLARPADSGLGPAETLVQEGHWKRARAFLDPYVANHPEDARAAYLLGHVKLTFGDTEGALKLAEKAIAAHRDADTLSLLSEIHGRQAETANVFRQYGLARKAKQESEAAIALDPRQIVARWFLFGYHLQAPGIVGGDKNKARVLAAEMLSIDPIEGNLAYAQLARLAKDQAAVERHYLAAAAARPDSGRMQRILSEYYFGLKKYDLAEKHGQEAVRLSPSQVWGYTALASVYAVQGRSSDLDAILARAQAAGPDNLYPQYRAAALLLREGRDLDRAERYLRQYLAQPPEAEYPSHATAHYRLGLIREKQNRKADAIAELETALRLDPKFEPAAKDLKRLK